jgi:hypothetical protein
MIQKLSPTEIVQAINQMVIIFDQCSEKYDVFKVETKADSSYMVVSGIQERTQQRRISNSVKYIFAFSFNSFFKL